MKENLKIVGVMVIVAIIFIGVVFGSVMGMSYGLAKPECIKKYSEYNPQWGYWEGCRINYNGKLTPVEMIKNINLE